MSYNSLVASEVKSEIGHELQSPIAPVSNNSKSEIELFPLVTSQGTTRFLDAKQVTLMSLSLRRFFKLVKYLQGEETMDRQPTLRPEVSAVRCQLPPLWPW